MFHYTNCNHYITVITLRCITSCYELLSQSGSLCIALLSVSVYPAHKMAEELQDVHAAHFLSCHTVQEISQRS